MKLAIGSDHAGYPLKVQLLDVLRRKGHEIQDYGSYDEKPVDFPDIAKKVTAAILSGEAERGIMFCGTGVGAAIACNKVRGIRASSATTCTPRTSASSTTTCRSSRLGAQIVGPTVAEELIDLFLAARFSTSEEFRRRVAKLDDMDAAR